MDCFEEEKINSILPINTKKHINNLYFVYFHAESSISSNQDNYKSGLEIYSMLLNIANCHNKTKKV